MQQHATTRLDAAAERPWPAGILRQLDRARAATARLVPDPHDDIGERLRQRGWLLLQHEAHRDAVRRAEATPHVEVAPMHLCRGRAVATQRLAASG